MVLQAIGLIAFLVCTSPTAARAQFPDPVLQTLVGPTSALTIEAQVLRRGVGGDVLLVAGVNFGTGVDWRVLRLNSELSQIWSISLNDVHFAQAQLLLSANGDLLLVGAHQQSLVVQRRRYSDGSLIWAHTQLTGVEPGQGLKALPPVAVDGMDLLIALAVDGDVQLLRLNAAGSPVATLSLADAGGTEIPTDLVALDNGGLIVTAIQEQGDQRRIRTSLLDASGGLIGADTESGDIAALLSGSQLIADPTGGAWVGANLESTCGVFQTRLWRLDANGKRDWTVVRPMEACVSWTLFDFQMRSDHGVYIGSNQQAVVGGSGISTFGLSLIDASGEVGFNRKWPDPAQARIVSPLHMARSDMGEVFMAGYESVEGGSTRPVAAVWNAQGQLCVAGSLGDTGAPRGLLRDAAGWLLALEVFSNGRSTLQLRRYASDSCDAPPLFSDGFEAVDR